MGINMFGTPGAEHRLRQAMLLYAGQEKYDAFWNGFYEKWLSEADIRFLAEMGCNSVRIPFNYRHFEDDSAPFVYKESGFKLLEQAVEWCGKYGIWAVLDLHACQGYQSGDWHCDNIFGEQVNLYYDRDYQRRYIALWQEIARRFKDNAAVAGYDLMNEPVCANQMEIDALNSLYREVVEAIRAIDKEHIIFLEGNLWSQDYSQIDAPFAEGLACSPHYYNLAAIRYGTWPMVIDGENYDRARMEADMDFRDEYMRRHNVPVWVGEFGVRRYENLRDKDAALRDYIDCFEQRGHSWCYWSFKDFGLRGPLYMRPGNAWDRFTKEMRDLKIKYHTDRAHTDAKPWSYEQFIGEYREGEFELSQKKLAELLDRNIRETLSDQLTLTFGRKFAELSVAEIAELTDSFKFENCEIYQPWADIFKSCAEKS